MAADLDVQPGDRVLVGLPDSGFLRASAALYLVPLVGMFAGAGLTEWLAQQLALASVDVLTLLGGMAGLGAGFAWQRGFGRRFSADPAHRPRLLRKLEGDACPPEASAPEG
jgi:sigma-E factor negative regulatory protein RseC